MKRTGRWAQLQVRRPPESPVRRDPRAPIPTGRLPSRREPGSTWAATLGSVLLHATVVLLILNQFRTPSQEQKKAERDPDAERVVQMVYLPPPPKPVPLPKVSTPPPPAMPMTQGPDQTPGAVARVNPTPERAPNALAEALRTQAKGPETKEPEGNSALEDEAPKPSAFAPTATPDVPTIESEAQRIFGKPLTRLDGTSGEETRPWENPLTWGSRGCTSEKIPDDSTAPPGMGIVQGVVYREGGRVPLPRAHLQILGTRFNTFSDDNGNFRLVFDRSLVDNCRTQSVRVSAPGFRTQDLTLYVGVPISSNVVMHRN
jgi:hypothetical protein